MTDQVIVIGAGGGGLVTARALAARRVPFAVLEARDGVGGMWRYDPRPGWSSAYASLRANTSRRNTSLRASPLRGASLFPRREELQRYLEDYSERFGLLDRIRLGAEVVAARRTDGDGWRVRTSAGDELVGRALVVATGHAHRPVVPDLPGTFDGLSLHARDYRTPKPFEDRDVVVAGLGCSAAELAVEIADVARSVTLAVRSGNWIAKRRVGPFPYDWFDNRLSSRLPLAVRHRLAARSLRAYAGDPRSVGLPAPPARAFAKPPALSDGLFAAIRSRRIAVAREVVELLGDRVRTSNARVLPAQGILWATGYAMDFPFLAPEVARPTMAWPGLYRGVASPSAPGLAFVGATAGIGAQLPLLEAQAEWLGDVLAGRRVLPDAEVMRASVARDLRVARSAHDAHCGYLVDRVAYIRAMERERRRPRPPEAATL